LDLSLVLVPLQPPWLPEPFSFVASVLRSIRLLAFSEIYAQTWMGAGNKNR
jgi:hypothetical protein